MIKNSDLMLPYKLKDDVTLSLQEIPALNNYRLVALTNVPKIFPSMVALWAAPGRDAVLQKITIPMWSDVHGPDDKAQSTEIATMPRTPTSIAAMHDWNNQHTLLLMTFNAGPNAIDVAEINIAP